MDRTIRTVLSMLISISFFSFLFPTLSTPQSVVQEPAPKSTAPPVAAGKQLTSREFTLSGSKIWTDTGITLEPGQRIVVTAEGKLRYSDAKADDGPEGLTRGFKDLLRILPLNSEGRGALIAKIGNPMSSKPFSSVQKRTISLPSAASFPSASINRKSIPAKVRIK